MAYSMFENPKRPIEMNVELANYLLKLEKHITEDNKYVENKSVSIKNPVKLRFLLKSKEDPDQIFLVDVKESAKKSLKISLHHQDDTTQNGLLRVDYYARHKNPEEILDTVPEHFKPYAGIYLDDYPGHIHYIVDGYPPLAWAIPLEVDSFPVKDIKDIIDITEALKAFFIKINLKTEIKFCLQKRLL